MGKLMSSRNPALKNLILVGCVKSKRSHTSAAQDLYNSRLWCCRRAYAERAGVPWYILSTKHGLLASISHRWDLKRPPCLV